MLSSKLNAALQSRAERGIRRTLPTADLCESSKKADFTSNDYLSLSTSDILRCHLRARLSTSPHIVGSGGSRLLVHSPAHADLEDRLKKFLKAPEALLFNSGFDANVGIFSCLPQTGDIVVYDEYVHASVHDGMRASRAGLANAHSFAHNDLRDFKGVLRRLSTSGAAGDLLRSGKRSLFVAVESLYSMDGTFAPLGEMVGILEEMFPFGNAYMIVDEAHATGIYGPQGRGRVAELGLESKVLVRLHTFGKALAATGAVVLCSQLVKDYLINYARPLIYTTALSPVNVEAVNCSIDMLENGVAAELADQLLELSSYLVRTLHDRLRREKIPPTLVKLPSFLTTSLPPHHSATPSTSDTPSFTPYSPIIPLLTSSPRPLSKFLLDEASSNARPITWPTVPKGRDRVRVCVHAGNTKEEIDRLVDGVVRWSKMVMREERRKIGKVAFEGLVESKL